MNNEGQINQLGTDGTSHDNTASIVQSGAGNNSMVSLGSNSGGAFINQGTQSAGSGNSFRNEASITQAGTGSGALINQYDNSFSNSARISQAGNRDYAEINQLTQSGNNGASITQGSLGGNNQAFVRQQNTDHSGAASSVQNSVTLEQNTTRAGGFNTIRVVQGYGLDFAGPATTLSVSNTVVGSQQGGGNDARLGQAGAGNTATFTQLGNDNVLYNANTDGTPGNSFAPMIGTGNRLTVSQTNEVTSGKANSNAAFVNISGTNNVTVISQTVGLVPLTKQPQLPEQQRPF